MNYQALYRKYRPQVFDDVKGQDVIVKTLRNQVRTGRIAHAYLFCGSRGTGKTTCAKILGKAINCERPVDGNPCGECESCRAIEAGVSMNLIEMDAASRNGVDDFRRIIEEIAYPPGTGSHKVYIIDEVHMLSPAAFNAFLKTLEEPPEYAVFILATTDPQRLLPTVLSRCQRFDFHRISASVIGERLKEVFAAENIGAEEDAVRSIARRSDGGMRDALSIADQCVSFFPGETLTSAHVLEVLGTAETEVYRSMLGHAVDGDASAMIAQFDDMLMDGKDVRQIVSDFIWYLRDLLIFKASGGSSEMDDLVAEERELLFEDAQKVDERQIMYYIEVLSDLGNSLRSASNRRVLAEIALISLCRPQAAPEQEGALEARIASIENQLSSGIYLPMGNAPAYPQDMRSDGGQNPQMGSGADMQPDGGNLPAGSGAQIQAKGGAPEEREYPKAVAPELFRRIAGQWKQTMSTLPNRGRGEILATCCQVSFSPDDPQTLYISMADNWYRSLGSDKNLLESIRDAIAAKYGTKPDVRFVNTSESRARGLSKIETQVEALKKEGIDFPIDVE